MTTWQAVYAQLNITPADTRLYKITAIKERRRQMCTLAEASDALEFERETTHVHIELMAEAITLGERGILVDDMTLKEWHRRLFPYGGQWRNCQVWLTCMSCQPPRRYLPTPYEILHRRMKAFGDSLRYTLRNGYEPFYALALIHTELERIHPFLDGNGRIGRLLLNHNAAYLGLSRIKIEDRKTYIRCLEEENHQGLAELFKRSAVPC